MYFDLFADQPITGLAVSFIVSLCIGSFLNVVIHRVPRMMELEWQTQVREANGEEIEPETYNLAKPASSCPSCQQVIHWYHNIPLLSYALLRGRCASCSWSIPLRYPVVELFTAIASTYGIYHFGFNEIGIAFALLTWFLISLLMIDLDHQLLPDRLTLPLLWAGLLVNSYSLFTSLHLAVFGAVAGYLLLWSVYWGFKLLTGKEGMGYGDFKLLAALGAWAGAPMLPLIVTLSALVGAVIGILMIATGRQNKDNPIPFGPFLAIAGWIAVLWGDQITNAYLQLL
ncbi:prepilin peptidase [Marinobacterium arenosum]|uniref:prepilin peptidase n=1 Tax=Marinobacterium arenosum TaxID=2862496 RepID=UPI001C985973|nr:A24 family peptidase [Marinobacterium arenosum]MBY4676586.1 A24 family peptidase [Marinobacterium arenosum]